VWRVPYLSLAKNLVWSTVLHCRCTIYILFITVLHCLPQLPTLFVLCHCTQQSFYTLRCDTITSADEGHGAASHSDHSFPARRATDDDA
jgi:hypothetical protein